VTQVGFGTHHVLAAGDKSRDDEVEVHKGECAYWLRGEGLDPLFPEQQEFRVIRSTFAIEALRRQERKLYS
jgi:hypothetical protein